MEITFHADENALINLSDDVGGLWCRPVAVLASPPDSFTFLRDYVHPNVPCIIKNAISSGVDGDTRPLTLTLDDIIRHVGEDTILTVDVTPDGHGDCIRSVIDMKNGSEGLKRRMFVKPHEKRMAIKTFRDLLRGGPGCEVSSINRDETMNSESNSNCLGAFPLRRYFGNVGKEYGDTESFFDGVGHPPVVYYSKQNDCLRTEVAKLFSTQIFPTTFSFAEEAFGTGPPDAINLWIGNERSVSSMHKDHYENLFYVCSGKKEFVLCPPADALFLHEYDFHSGTFCPLRRQCIDSESEDQHGPSWVVVADDKQDDGEDNPRKTKWIEPDILKYLDNGDNEFPLLSKAHPVKIIVSEGEMLYIPSLWYHRVTQTCETVGVNYWFDMKFDGPNWVYFNFLQNCKRSEPGELKL